MQIIKNEISLKKKYKKEEKTYTSITIKPNPLSNQSITIMEIDGEVFLENIIGKYNLFNKIRENYKIKVTSEILL